MKFGQNKLISLMAFSALAACSNQPESDSQTALQAQIIVDADAVFAQQNPLFYGGNNIYPKGGQGLLNIKSGEFDQQTLKMSAELGLRTYRFPGGSEGNLYKWKRAIGPVDQRIDNVSGNNQGPQSNELGPDEFGRLLETTTFDQGVIMVAYGYEKPDDAADWVEYMNAEVGENPNGGIDWAAVRAKNGHPEPYNIKYWEIGNEVYGNWELNWGSYPHKGDAKRGTGNVVFDDTTGKAGTLPFGSADRYIHGGYKYFQQQKAAAKSSWKDQHIKTNGQANQSFYVKFAPVSLAQADKPFVVTINGIKWQRVDTFSNSGPKDKHYLLQPDEGKITFGDGKNGLIPPAGQFVMLDYLSGKQPGFIDYYHKMKAVDPSIVILSCFEKESFYKLMAEAKQPYDGVVKHYYPPLPKNVSPEEFYRHSVYKGLQISRPMHEHQVWTKRYPNPALTGNEKLWLTEYGIRGHMEQQVIMQTVINKYSDQIGSLLGHSLFLNNNTPMITDQGYYRARALPVPLFSKLSQNNFVKSEVAAPSYRIKNQVIPAVLSTASISDDKSEMSIVLTNTYPDKAVNAEIDLKGFKPDPSAPVEVWRLASRTDKVIDENRPNQTENVQLTREADISYAESLNFNMAKGSIYLLKWQAE
ncbi:hypothetical protein [Gayadomonas joobiniege]|uniref:hypothetical protein n=1 Tax=Gayadomonas joobiniege TaxID=1234606 RepID=UPI00037171B6|nr:hypothetical protein [Gayadomonas joobiniege]